MTGLGYRWNMGVMSEVSRMILWIELESGAIGRGQRDRFGHSVLTAFLWPTSALLLHL